MRRVFRSLALALSVFPLLLAPAGAQPTFSVESQGPSVTTPALDSFFGLAIGDGDILTSPVPGPPGPNPPAPGPLAPPGTEVGAAAGAVAVVSGGLGVIPSLAGCREVDALSYGFDAGDTLYFSVDEFASGVPGSAPPSVSSEGVVGAGEASADTFYYLGPVALAPPVPGAGNAAFLDGDGLPPSGRRGLGLIEPNPASPGSLPDPGDNLDALDVDTLLPLLSGPIFFSLDGAFPDLLEAAPVNCGTALANGVSGADVLVTSPGAMPGVAIPAGLLGLDLAGFGSDDLDALSFDDADASLSLTAGDTIFFSVRRGSAVIGASDSAFGAPISEGDILVPPALAGAPPAIFVSAEALGLGTLRSATAGPFGLGDELDALDMAPAPPPVPVPALGPWGIVALIAALATAPVLGLGTRRRRR